MSVWKEKKAQAEQIAIEQFAFLHVDFGFKPLPQLFRAGVFYTSVIYLGTTFWGVEIALDFYDRYTTVNLVRLDQGKAPTTVAYGQNGKMIRVRLLDALQSIMGINNDTMKQIWNTTIDIDYEGHYLQDVANRLYLFAQLLKETIPTINQQTEATLFPHRDRIYRYSPDE